jgi:hypothetical protein
MGAADDDAVVGTDREFRLTVWNKGQRGWTEVFTPSSPAILATRRVARALLRIASPGSHQCTPPFRREDDQR